MTIVESWNGTSWTEVGDLNTGRFAMACAGTSTAGLAFGGGSPPKNETETWNGTSWTETANLNTARYALAGDGTSTAALGAGGQSSTAIVGIAETWNGTGWTEGVDMNTARVETKGAGTTTAAVVFGGTPPVMNNSEEFTAPLETTVEFDAS